MLSRLAAARPPPAAAGATPGASAPGRPLRCAAAGAAWRDAASAPRPAGIAHGEVHIWWLHSAEVRAPSIGTARGPDMPECAAPTARRLLGRTLKAPLHPSPSQVDELLLERYAALLPPWEAARAAEAADAATRKQRVLARALVRCTLARYLPGAHPSEVHSGQMKVARRDLWNSMRQGCQNNKTWELY
jgi:hypothetical protein